MNASHSSSTMSVFRAAADLAAQHIESRGDAPVVGEWTEQELADRLRGYDFEAPRNVVDVAADLFSLLERFAVRSDSPRYFGLFNPPPLAPAVIGDLVTAAVNPQLAVWSHAPAAAEIEQRMIRFFGGTVWPDVTAAGTFTSGGSEANFTALLCALSRCEGWAEGGARALALPPIIYASSESHLAWIKLARAAGLGANAVRLVSADDGLRVSADALRRAIADDPGQPVLVVATAGTTAHGAIDDIAGMAEVARQSGAYFHVDAAWAGGALIDPQIRSLMSGIEAADSVTIDPHKWLAVPMGAGMFLARDWADLERTFTVRTSYMPSADEVRRDAYIHSAQWSRRFIGGKLFVALATLGIGGYRELITAQIAAADRLRSALRREGWRLVNDTFLPLVCFAPAQGGDRELRGIEEAVSASGRAWISSVMLRGRLVLRACITSFETSSDDVDELVLLLNSARERWCGGR